MAPDPPHPAPPSRRTALHLACASGWSFCAEKLVDSGASINLQDKKGRTALHHAAASDNEGNLDDGIDTEDEPLNEANIQSMFGRSFVCINTLLRSGAVVDCTDEYGEMPTHKAARVVRWEG